MIGTEFIVTENPTVLSMDIIMIDRPIETRIDQAQATIIIQIVTTTITPVILVIMLGCIPIPIRTVIEERATKETTIIETTRIVMTTIETVIIETATIVILEIKRITTAIKIEMNAEVILE
jgi:hypothetical protein